MKIEDRDINLLKEYKLNAKKHDKSQIEKIANSIREFGWGQPIVIDKKNEIIIGHGRYNAAKLLDLKKVPVLIMDNLTEKKVKALRLADNKLNESSWDMKLVIDELKDIKVGSVIDLSGFGDVELEVFDIEKEWTDMPEFIQNDATSERQVIVHFENNEDAQEFFNKLDIKGTDKTKSIWFPYKENRKAEDIYE